jgi:hypothetical protein
MQAPDCTLAQSMYVIVLTSTFKGRDCTCNA